jgi:hypothetical protein
VQEDLDMLTEERVMELVTLANKYAIAHNLEPEIYIENLLNPNTIGNADAKVVVDCLIKYHKEWLAK